MAADRLSPEEVARYREQGYIVPRYRVPAARLAAMRALLERLIAENPGRRPEHLVLRWGGGVAARPTDAAFLDHARDPEILDLVEQLIGPDIVLWGSHVFCKPAGHGLEVPWHQDGQYWPIRPLASVTVWLALDASRRENGCLRVIPGSHRTQSIYHHRLDERPALAINQVVDDARFDEGRAVDVELEAGQLSIHDVYMLHGSRPNRSDQRRAGFASRYMPATSLYDRSIAFPGGSAGIKQNMALRPIYLVRGQDRAGNDFSLGQDRPFQVGDDG
ncbi:MAG: phytanoyl-CoA dioxygenase family protein [Alphaproteobacteria bacterium]|nr:phytanoyl-CoA dioxygenase family protein [Alphaproteobacteria bacterium]